MSFGLLLGTAGSLSAGHVGLGVVFGVLLVALLTFVAVRARSSAARQL